jgi:Na+-transporting methylmalonyl-CoA/oxaloacetate decarboxylase gamma subunit
MIKWLKTFFKVWFGLGILSILIYLVFFNGEVSEQKTKEETPKVTKVEKKPMKVSFNKVQQNGDLIVCYTGDSEDLWSNNEWKNEVKKKMKELNGNTILLFNSYDNTPNIKQYGYGFPTMYDKYMVSGYWIYPNGNTKFCYGGVKDDGNFVKCN